MIDVTRTKESSISAPVDVRLTPFCDFMILDKNPEVIEDLARQELLRGDFSEEAGADIEIAMAVAIMYQRRLDESVALISSVLQRFPEHPTALWCDALLSIYLQEPWAVALRKFQARWAVRVNGDLPMPEDRMWDGSPLNGRTVLFAGEGGRGDQIQFLRFVSTLKATGAGRVIVSVRSDLVELARTVEGVDAVVSTGQDSNVPLDAEQYDAGVPMMSAPGLLRLSYETLPASVPYIQVPATRIEEGHRRLKAAGDSLFKVGLCRLASKEFRSLPLELFRPLAGIPGVQLFSLAEDSSLDERSAGYPILSLGSSDILADAGSLCALDLVISVDTMIAHLAGSLGRPVWLLLSYFPDCRWGLEAATTKWYPTMRLFRRETRHWEGVIENVVGDLANLVESRRV